MGPLYSLKAVAHWLRHGHWAVTRTLESWDCVECERIHEIETLPDTGEETVDGAIEVR